MYTDGQIGSGTSKYIHYLIRELESQGVEVVRLQKGENPRQVDVLHDPHAPWNAPLRTHRPLLLTIQDLSPWTFPQYYGRWVRTLFLNKLRYLIRRATRMLVPSHRTARVVSEAFRPRVPIDVIYYGIEAHFRPGAASDAAKRPFLVQVGVHRKVKEPMVTLRAFETIAATIPHDLLFVGTDNVLLGPVKTYTQSRPALAGLVRARCEARLNHHSGRPKRKTRQRSSGVSSPGDFPRPPSATDVNASGGRGGLRFISPRISISTGIRVEREGGTWPTQARASSPSVRPNNRMPRFEDFPLAFPGNFLLETPKCGNPP